LLQTVPIHLGTAWQKEHAFLSRKKERLLVALIATDIRLEGSADVAIYTYTAQTLTLVIPH